MTLEAFMKLSHEEQKTYLWQKDLQDQAMEWNIPWRFLRIIYPGQNNLTGKRSEGTRLTRESIKLKSN